MKINFFILIQYYFKKWLPIKVKKFYLIILYLIMIKDFKLVSCKSLNLPYSNFESNFYFTQNFQILFKITDFKIHWGSLIINLIFLFTFEELFLLMSLLLTLSFRGFMDLHLVLFIHLIFIFLGKKHLN